MDKRITCKTWLLCSSNAFDDDLPYIDPTGLIIVPYALDTNDMKFFHPNGFVLSNDMADYVVDALDVLENEWLLATKASQRWFSFTYHWSSWAF